MNQEISNFCTSWLTKSRTYDSNNLQGAFDKFFTLFVVYNRLYVELTFRLSNKGLINLINRKTFPDANAAKVYSVEYLTSTVLNNAFDSSPDCLIAIEELKNIIRNNTFNIKLNMVTGVPMPDKDSDLLSALESSNTANRMKAITDYLYSVRCNTFHAQKGYTNDQIELLRPICILLEKIIELIFDKLRNEPD